MTACIPGVCLHCEGINARLISKVENSGGGFQDEYAGTLLAIVSLKDSNGAQTMISHILLQGEARLSSELTSAEQGLSRGGTMLKISLLECWTVFSRRTEITNCNRNILFLCQIVICNCSNVQFLRFVEQVAHNSSIHCYMSVWIQYLADNYYIRKQMDVNYIEELFV